MDLFAGLVRGGLGGLLGAAFGHMGAVLLLRTVGQDFLKGPYGPPFLAMALDLAAPIGFIAFALSLKPRPTAVGFLGPLLGIVLPMIVLTRTAQWGMNDAASTPTPQWAAAVGGLYIVSTWATLLALGALLSQRRLAGALAGAGGAFAGYLLLAALLWAAPSYQQVRYDPKGLIPSPVDLFTGMLTGAGLGAGISLVSRRTS